PRQAARRIHLVQSGTAGPPPALAPALRSLPSLTGRIQARTHPQYEGRTQRALPLREREQIQEVLRLIQRRYPSSIGQQLHVPTDACTEQVQQATHGCRGALELEHRTLASILR